MLQAHDDADAESPFPSHASPLPGKTLLGASLVGASRDATDAFWKMPHKGKHPNGTDKTENPKVHLPTRDEATPYTTKQR